MKLPSRWLWSIRKIAIWIDNRKPLEASMKLCLTQKLGTLSQMRYIEILEQLNLLDWPGSYFFWPNAEKTLVSCLVAKLPPSSILYH